MNQEMDYLDIHRRILLNSFGCLLYISVSNLKCESKPRLNGPATILHGLLEIAA